MAEKRKLPPRQRRESAAKRQAASPPPAPQPVGRPRKKVASTPPPPPPPHESPAPVMLEDTLPKKMKDGQPLPVLHEAQPATLSAKEYQTVAERCISCSHRII